MRCPFLEGSKINYCRADDRLFVPSLLELTVFCSSEPDECALYHLRESCAPKKDMHTGQVMGQAVETAPGAVVISAKQQRS